MTVPKTTLSIIIPCYNEYSTLQRCIDRVFTIQSATLSLDIIIVDDGSSDTSFTIASNLSRQHPEITILHHEKNLGKGAAIHSGIKAAKGNFIAIQDADLEYNPMDLIRLLHPLIKGNADVVFGSRFLSNDEHRVLYFWHSVGNRFLTLLSNMLTDLNLTDMETCYKVFKRELLQSLDLNEKRFGFEPEVVAKVAHKRVRIYEMGISYAGRTYEEGKKISAKDGFRAIFCILKYNLPTAPLPIQLLIYLFIGGASGGANLGSFLTLSFFTVPLIPSTILSFYFAAVINYILTTLVLFRKNARWRTKQEYSIYFFFVSILASLDALVTTWLFHLGSDLLYAKIQSTLLLFLLNFLVRKYIVFYEKPRPAWGAPDQQQ